MRIKKEKFDYSISLHHIWICMQSSCCMDLLVIKSCEKYFRSGSGSCLIDYSAIYCVYESNQIKIYDNMCLIDQVNF